jgi:aryl-alcohol dehydrogenase-like predicted oxidoreductase
MEGNRIDSISDMEHYELAPNLKICRILNGMWQVAGGHGPIDPKVAVEEMVKYHNSGFTTWDLADIYDLVQFHWWDYNNPYYIDAIKYLSSLRDETKIIKNVGLTNFDTERMQIMVKDAGLKEIVSNQIQYSIVDRRPEAKMVRFCRSNNISLLAYGTVCGGLMSERYFGKPEPSSYELDTASLRKYKRMIDAWAGWKLFQELLSTLHQIAQKHGVSIANIATRYILDRPTVAGVIIGARLGIADHRGDNIRVFDFRLDKDDTNSIEEVSEKSNDLFDRIGDCGDEYRRR